MEQQGVRSSISTQRTTRRSNDSKEVTIGTDDTVGPDYMLNVDAGGNDTYVNNAGGNLIDVRAEPKGLAKGCSNSRVSIWPTSSTSRLLRSRYSASGSEP